MHVGWQSHRLGTRVLLWEERSLGSLWGSHGGESPCLPWEQLGWLRTPWGRC